MSEQATIFVVDDDAAVRDSLALLLEEENFAVECFASADDFLANGSAPARSCAIVDIRMPGMDGMQLQSELSRRGMPMPLIFLTGHGSIAMSVRAIKGGAVDFLTKPVDGAVLLKSIGAALLEDARQRSQAETAQTARTLVASLTGRERQVMLLAVEGMHNKEIARCLGISHRTVEIHKARILRKTGAATLLDLARLAEASGVRG